MVLLGTTLFTIIIHVLIEAMQKEKIYYLAAHKCTLKTSVTASLCVPPTFFFRLPFPIASAIVHLFTRLIK